MYLNIKDLQSIINSGSKDGFTTCLKGNTKRYIVAFTNNTDLDIKRLESQIDKSIDNYSNLNIGGWTDIKSGISYIDLSTSFDNKKEAISYAINNNQIAIWDNKELIEIRV